MTTTLLGGTHDHLELLLSEGEVGIWELDVRTGAATRNLRHDAIFGYDTLLPEWTFEKFLGHVTEDYRADVKERFEKAVAKGEKWSFQTPIRRADGELGWISACGQPIKDEAGETIILIGHVFDITDIKRSEERMKLLAGELSHRVNNTLALVRSMITLSARSAGSVSQFVDVLQTRLAALARTNRLLTNVGESRSQLRDLIEAEFSPYQEVRPRVSVTCDPGETLGPKEAEAVSLALHELCTNAIKHGSLSNDSGTLEIVASRCDKGILRLVWQESGGPRVRAPGRNSGFGSQLLPRVLEAHGHIEIDYRPEGVRCEILIGQAARAGFKSRSAAVVPKPRPRLLLVENESLIAIDLAETLADAGYEVIGPVATAAAALELVSPILTGALLDINLDDGTSAPVADALRDCGVPFVLMSGRSGEDDLADNYRDATVLIKPFTSRQILEQARRLVALRTKG